MEIAALATWLVTAAVGFFMLMRWIRRGGLRSAPGAATHFPPALVFTHFGLAAGGLVVWIAYLVTDSSLLAWAAFADLVLVAMLGGLLVRRWTIDGRAAMAAGAQLDAGRPGRATHPATTRGAARDLRGQHRRAGAAQRARCRPGMTKKVTW